MRAMNPMNLLPALRPATRSTVLPPTASDKISPPLPHDTSAPNLGSIPGLGYGSSSGSPDEKEAQSHEATHEEGEDNRMDSRDAIDEKSPLLARQVAQKEWPSPLHKRIGGAAYGACRLIVSALLAPGRYLIACFYDDSGRFSIFVPFQKLGSLLVPKKRRKHRPLGWHESNSNARSQTKSTVNRDHLASPLDEKASAITSESELESDSAHDAASEDSPSRHTRSKSATADETDSAGLTRSIRIKTTNQDDLRRRTKQKRANDGSKEPPLTVDTIKSPTGSATSPLALTRYPRAPAPPRPLVPRRQPSYSTMLPTASRPQKTLVIDLDETLIHSMAKGGRMSTGHMVEVKLSSPVGIGGTILAPQVPILYYVHKRPHCDEFLRKVSKWYNLIVFTASVQEYADPVIDWLELERKYFTARYYRQHCTYRNGSYIKDLSQVEPDLSRVMILDNSPISYIFHEDNAIPIEGWISDPTDNDLLHLVPLLEGLQHTTDVRALLALRLGEAGS